MKKLVPETLSESMNLDEGIFQDIKDAVKAIFKKVGKFFASIYKGKTLEVVHPVNIGIFEQENMLPKGFHFIPSSKTIQINPELAPLREKNLNLYKNGGLYDKSVYNRKTTDITNINQYIKESKMYEDDSKPLDIFVHEDKEIPDVNNVELMRRIRMVVDTQIGTLGKDGEPDKESAKATPLLIWGTTGIAKTEIGNTVLEMLGRLDAQVIVVPLATMAREDWSVPKEKNERAVACYVDWLPLYRKTGNPELDAKGNDEANRGGGGILFFDEISRSSKGLIASLLTLVQSRRLGDWYLGSKWCIIAASNRLSDDIDSEYNFSSALGNRFDHVNFIPSHASWADYAKGGTGMIRDSKKIPLGQWKRMLGNWRVDPRIVEFTEFNRDFWHTLKKGEPNQIIYASPRTWTNASHAIDYAIQDEEKYGEGISYSEMENIVAASVGKTAAKQFMTFMRLLQQYTTKDIKKVLEDPMKAPLPTKKGSGYDLAEANALLFVVCSYTKNKPITPQEWENFNQYLVRLDNASLATKGHKLMVEVNAQTVEKRGPDHISTQLGDLDDPTRPGKKRDKYLKGYEIFKAKYGDHF